MESEKRTSMVPLVIGLAVIAVAVFIGAALLLGFWPGFGPVGPTGPMDVVGSGKLVTRDMDFRDFTIVDVGSAFNVEITQSSSYSVTITMDDNLFDYLQASKTGERLRIRLEPAFFYRSVTLRAKVTMPDLHELELSGATRGTVEGFSPSHGVTIEVSGASHLTGGIMVGGDVRFSLSGASSAELEGAAGDMVADVSGASSLDLSNFPVHNADVNLGGASRGTVNLDGRLDADARDASHLLYVGDPTLGDIRTSGASTVGKK